MVPFATSLIATYLDQRRGQVVAAGVYAGSFLGVELTHDRRREIILRAVVGVAPYAIATAVAPLSPYATLIICGAIAVFYALPMATGSDSG